jgi:hypothetical protein
MVQGEAGLISKGECGVDRDREERIRERAYQIWEREGREEGSHGAHWQRAERELDEEEQEGGTETPRDESPQIAGDASTEGTARRKR